jgi:hypothetical protein
MWPNQAAFPGLIAAHQQLTGDRWDLRRTAFDLPDVPLLALTRDIIGPAGSPSGGEEARIRTADHLHAGRTDGRRGMKSKDEIVEHVRAARESYAARFNYDLARMFDDLKAKSARAVAILRRSSQSNSSRRS